MHDSKNIVDVYNSLHIKRYYHLREHSVVELITAHFLNPPNYRCAIQLSVSLSLFLCRISRAGLLNPPNNLSRDTRAYSRRRETTRRERKTDGRSFLRNCRGGYVSRLESCFAREILYTRLVFARARRNGNERRRMFTSGELYGSSSKCLSTHTRA